VSPGTPARGKAGRRDTFTFFDFDCGGPTWRAFDLAWCRMEVAQAKESGLWGAFLRGYRERRPLSRADHLAVSWFVLAIHIWWMGLIADLGREWGTSWFDQFITQQVDALRRWEKTVLDG
jgi:Ser/Thr protein kinase RdoA (MazF antagonist)